MITEITIYKYDDKEGVRYRTDSEPTQEIIGLSPSLQKSVNDIMAYVGTLKTALEKSNMAMDFIKTNATVAQKLSLMSIYPIWENEKAYALGAELRYGQVLYSVLQAHTSQLGWTPSVTPSLFKVIQVAGVAPAFVQPTGAHDAYALGARVIFNTKTYESLIAANTYSPTAYPAGWKLI